MSIEYTYEIASVDEAARCMEVVYSSVGRETMRIGARLPFAEEPLESVIEMYAPVRYWQEKELPVVVPVVGQRGVIQVLPPAPPVSPNEVVL